MKKWNWFILTVFVTMIVSAMSASADVGTSAHEATVTLSPELANCADIPTDYTVNVAHDSGFDIYNVKIYRGSAGIFDITCGAAPPGWSFEGFKFGLYCEYLTDPEGADVIGPGEDLDFTFTADFQEDVNCTTTFRITTLDNEGIITGGTGEEKEHLKDLLVDCGVPQVTKEVIGPQVGDLECPPGAYNSSGELTDADQCWINTDTIIEVTCEDPGILQCTDDQTFSSGLARMVINTVVDGDPTACDPGSTVFVSEENCSIEFIFTNDNVTKFSHNITYSDDSVHDLEVKCFDRAGNQLIEWERFRVDGTEPETTKHFIGPQKFVDTPDGVIEWIDGVTTVEMTPVDPDPTTFQCNIGVDKTWWRNDMAINLGDTSEGSCWNPDEFCNANFVGLPTPYDQDPTCVEEAQRDCIENGHEHGTEEWFNCVEEFIDSECDIDEGWSLYRGEPIPKDEESCHVLQFFSVDHLGNIEETNFNCFFVDKTPPAVTYEIVGHEPVACDINDSSGCDYWIRQDNEIHLWCNDQEPHPSGMVSLNYRTWDDISGLWTDWTEVMDGSNDVHAIVTWGEDSVHKLQYYCYDGVNKTNGTEAEPHELVFRIDSTAPTIETMVHGPQCGVCPPGTPADECYVNGETIIELWAEDPDPTNNSCNIGIEQCSYHVCWIEGNNLPSEVSSATDDFNCPEGVLVESAYFSDHVNFTFNEDSTHTLYVECSDLLWNMEMINQTYKVDMTPPETIKTYGEPRFPDEGYGPYCIYLEEEYCDFDCADGICDITSADYAGCHRCSNARWITTNTPIELNTTDNKVDNSTTYWRNLLVGDDMEGDKICGHFRGDVNDSIVDYCNPDYYMDFVVNPDEPFNEYVGPFTKDEESCHIIEYYAEDKLGNTEDLKWQCVFVDDTPPEGFKDVGEHSIFIGEGGDMGDGGRPATDNVEPNMLDMSMTPGETFSVEKDVTTGEVAVGEPEIYFLVDTTGSMSGPIGAVQGSIGDILDSIDASFGAGQYKDFPDDIFAYSNDQSITETEALVSGAVGAMFAAGGGDTPEGQLFALQQIAENEVGFDSDASKIVVWFGDAPGHDPVCAAISGEGSDITEASVTTALVDAGITVIAISTTSGAGGLDLDPTVGGDYFTACGPAGGAVGQATRIAAATGGIHLTDVSSAEIVDAIIDSIDVVTGSTDVIPDASDCEEQGLEVSFMPPLYTNISGSTTVTFNETVTLPNGTPEEPIHCDVLFKSDLGGVIGVQKIWINGDENMSMGGGTGIDWFVNQWTPIWLGCTDPAPHPVGHEELCFQVAWEGDERGETDVDLTEQYCHGLVNGVASAEGYGLPYFDNETGYCCVEQPSKALAMPYRGTCEEYCAMDVGCVDEGCGEAMDYCIMECEWERRGGVDFHFYFQNDSIHRLEFQCTDALGNTNEKDIEWFAVDSVPPVTMKTFTGPFHTDIFCLENGSMTSVSSSELSTQSDTSECHTAEYMDTATRVVLEATDPEPHPSGVHEIHYRVSLVEDNNCGWQEHPEYCLPCDGNESECGNWTLYEGPFPIDEESCHMIEYFSADNLWNEEDVQTNCVFVDKQPPVIEFSFDDHTYEDENGSIYISTMTHVQKESVYDPEPHPSGVAEVAYRYTLVADEACRNTTICEEAVGSGDFTPFEDSFVVDEESCHLIEIMATDNVNKSNTARTCVFVDDTAPTPNKTVGEPKSPMSEENQQLGQVFYPELGEGVCDVEGACWDITLLTPIHLGCVDEGPHPSGASEACFQVGLDGEDRTEQYCDDKGGEFNGTGDGFCCINSDTDFLFNEETWHKLTYYCVDNTWNQGEVDMEWFKVDGTPFSIYLYKKWNLISVPFVLLDDSPEAVFGGLEHVDSVWSYNPETGEWEVWSPGAPSDLTEIVPGWGYWVLMAEDETMTIGGSLLQPAKLPPSRPLSPGWNLIGPYGTQWEHYTDLLPEEINFMCGDEGSETEEYFGSEVYCALNSLVDTQQGFPRWSSLWSYVNCGDHDAGWTGLNACPTDFGSSQAGTNSDFLNQDRMYAGRGYWVEMDVMDLYAPATNCVWNENNLCISS